MKKLLFIVFILAGCKKEASNIIYPSGTQFNLKNISLNSIALPSNGIMVIPQNPFTIDDIWHDDLSTVRFYTCHSANGNSYKMPESNMDIISIPSSNLGK